MIYGAAEVPKWSAIFSCGGRGADGTQLAATRALVEEVAVAFVYNGTTEAVMMATPADLEDFALGFSLNEGVIGDSAELSDLSVVLTEHGVELRMWLGAARGEAYRARRRRLAGPTGCGLCGIESLAQAVRPLRHVAAPTRLPEADVSAMVSALAARQALNRETRAAHAAGFYRPGSGLLAVREDVGRHNALDKLAGAMARASIDAAGGALAITSRVSVEMVQKAAAIGAPVLVAISAPTALAVRAAAAANITLVGVARGDGYQVFSHPWRITDAA